MKLTKSYLKQVIMEETKRAKRKRGFGQGVPAKGKFSRKQEYFLEEGEERSRTLMDLREKFTNLKDEIVNIKNPEQFQSNEIEVLDLLIDVAIELIVQGKAAAILNQAAQKLLQVLKAEKSQTPEQPRTT